MGIIQEGGGLNFQKDCSLPSCQLTPFRLDFKAYLHHRKVLALLRYKLMILVPKILAQIHYLHVFFFPTVPTTVKIILSLCRNARSINASWQKWKKSSQL